MTSRIRCQRLPTYETENILSRGLGVVGFLLMVFFLGDDLVAILGAYVTLTFGEHLGDLNEGGYAVLGKAFRNIWIADVAC